MADVQRQSRERQTEKGEGEKVQCLSKSIYNVKKVLYSDISWKFLSLFAHITFSKTLISPSCVLLEPLWLDMLEGTVLCQNGTERGHTLSAEEKCRWRLYQNLNERVT